MSMRNMHRSPSLPYAANHLAYLCNEANMSSAERMKTCQGGERRTCMLCEATPRAATDETLHMPKHPQRSAGPCERHVHAPHILQEPNVAPCTARAAPVATMPRGPNTGEDDYVSLTSLEGING